MFLYKLISTLSNDESAVKSSQGLINVWFWETIEGSWNVYFPGNSFESIGRFFWELSEILEVMIY